MDPKMKIKKNLTADDITDRMIAEFLISRHHSEHWDTDLAVLYKTDDDDGVVINTDHFDCGGMVRRMTGRRDVDEIRKCAVDIHRELVLSILN